MTATSPGQQNATPDQTPSTSSEPAKRPIWEIVADIGAQIPEVEWEKVPPDASINYKHYLYGAPKQNT
jgi:hypothetical protein